MHNSNTEIKRLIKKTAISNIDKLSFNKRGSRKTYTPYGIVKLCSHSKGKRRFSVSSSTVLPNRGFYTFRSLRMKILDV